MIECIGGQAVARVDLEHDVVLADLRELGCDLTLSEGIVERVIDGLNTHAETRCGGTVDVQCRARGFVLLVGDHVLDLGQ